MCACEEIGVPISRCSVGVVYLVRMMRTLDLSWLFEFEKPHCYLQFEKPTTYTDYIQSSVPC